MSAFSQLVFYLLTAAFVQNLVLSAGFGSSTLLRLSLIHIFSRKGRKGIRL